MIPHIHLWTKQQLKLYKSIFTVEHSSYEEPEASWCQDCGLFAIASATSLAFGEDPSTREYCQAKMRTHLLKCFVNKYFELFP